MNIETEKYTIPTKTEYLENVREIVHNFVNENLEIDSLTLMRLTLVTDEAVANIIEHGHKFDPNFSIKFQAKIDDNRISLIIQDEADHGFHPDDIAEVDVKEHVANRKKSGLGWHIIRTIMDEVKYEHLSDGGNLLTLHKYHSGNGKNNNEN